MNGMSLRPDCNGNPYICDSSGLVCDTADINRRWLVTGIQDGGRTSGFNGALLNFGIRSTSDNVDRVISESGMVENMGVEVGIATPSLTVEKLFPLPV